MIPRIAQTDVEAAMARAPVTAILGPRQCGKTTLARMIAAGRAATFFDLESERDRARLQNPELALRELSGLVIIDEIQRLPQLFEVLRVVVDEESPGDRRVGGGFVDDGLEGIGTQDRRFLILGSASPELVKGVSESLAGRVEFVDLGGFTIEEVVPGGITIEEVPNERISVEGAPNERISVEGAPNERISVEGAPNERISVEGSEEVAPEGITRRLWTRGGFPRSYLAATDADSVAWREGFIRTFLERDIPQLGITIPAATLRRFWTMIAHYNARLWNAAELGRSMGVNEKTTRRYLDILSGTYMVRQLQPWHENIRKRQVKSPKIYFRDTGVLHTLLALPDHTVLTGHPAVGASWEAFALEQVVQSMGLRNAHFWATHQGAELDLMFFAHGKRYGVEFKYSEAPRTTRSMRVAIEDLGLEHLFVVYPGSERYALDDHIEVVPVGALPVAGA